jgi:hypothetical protein
MSEESSGEKTVPAESIESLDRRLFLRSLGKWSGAVILAVTGGTWLTSCVGSWINRGGVGGGGGWINRRGVVGGGSWINRRRVVGGGGWINRRVGGGSGWINRW